MGQRVSRMPQRSTHCRTSAGAARAALDWGPGDTGSDSICHSVAENAEWQDYASFVAGHRGWPRVDSGHHDAGGPEYSCEAAFGRGIVGSGQRSRATSSPLRCVTFWRAVGRECSRSGSVRFGRVCSGPGAVNRTERGLCRENVRTCRERIHVEHSESAAVAEGAGQGA